MTKPIVLQDVDRHGQLSHDRQRVVARVTERVTHFEFQMHIIFGSGCNYRLSDYQFDYLDHTCFQSLLLKFRIMTPP
jgi:hypothetical protein